MAHARLWTLILAIDFVISFSYTTAACHNGRPRDNEWVVAVGERIHIRVNPLTGPAGGR